MLIRFYFLQIHSFLEGIKKVLNKSNIAICALCALFATVLLEYAAIYISANKFQEFPFLALLLSIMLYAYVISYLKVRIGGER